MHTDAAHPDRFGVALLSVSRRAPKLVALVAQSEERDEDGFQIAPPGINVILLPFADDIRNIAVSYPTPSHRLLTQYFFNI